MKRSLLFLLLSATFLLNSLPAAAQKDSSYERLWQITDSLIGHHNLPKSALEKVMTVYARAKKEGNEAQAIKALLYWAALQPGGDGESTIAAIRRFEEEEKAATGPAASLLKSLTAGLYWNYYQQHRWKLYNRTATGNFKKDDIRTWGSDDFHRQITTLYQASLRNAPLLKRTPIERYEAIIQKGDSRHLRPTLYDLLAHRALEYFKSGERDLKKATYHFELDQAEAFAPANQFIAFRFVTKDTLSLQHKALLLYQNLISFHLPDTTPAALLDVDLERLQYVYQHSVAPTREEDYRKALEHLYKRYGTGTGAGAGYLLAAFYNGQAETYHPHRDTTHRYARLKAKEILEAIVKDSVRKSEGWTNSYNLLQSIIRPTLILSLEKVNLPLRPFRALVAFQNLPAVYFRLFPATDALKRELQLYESSWPSLRNALPLHSWKQDLPPSTDAQRHSTEVKMPALPAGEYILMGSADSSFHGQNGLLAGQSFFVSSISLVTQDDRVFVLHRETGQPLAGATVTVGGTRYNQKEGRYEPYDQKSYRTDSRGQASFKKSGDYSYFQLEVTYRKERLKLDESFYNPRRNRDEEDEEDEEDTPKKIIFFTDRAIYRPGQTVYFKGIVLHERGRNKARIATGYKTMLYLEDANSTDLDSLEVVTNEYGSFSGHFRLPKTALNGSFVIYDEEVDNEVSFQVEEYKRPSYFVEFDKIGGSYKVGDSVRVTGTAKAYAGQRVAGAKVSYRIVRQPRFLYSWLLPAGRRMSSDRQEIAWGETETDQQGAFTILFPALPDRKIDPALEPIFEYTVTTEITDEAGETRSGEQTVTAGYKALRLQVIHPAKEPLEKGLKSLRISTQNGAGEFIPALVQVKISRLKPENRLIRKRYWERPDQFVMTKEEYLSLFPNDEYDNESDYRSWPREAVLTHTDSSRRDGQFTLPEAAYTPGYYEIAVMATNGKGETVKDIRFTELFTSGSNHFSYPQYLWVQGITTPLEPGQKGTIQIGSASKNVFLINAAERGVGKQTRTTYRYLSLDREKKGFRFPVSESDRGGFGLSFFFVKDNRYYEFSQTVMVPWTNKELNLTYTTFRDKTLPGSSETWTVTISGHKGEGAAAEMLASMYDASLDQFVPHQWHLPRLWPTFRTTARPNSGQNFTSLTSTGKWLAQPDRRAFRKEYDRLLSPANLVYHLQQLDREVYNQKARSVTGAAPLREVVVAGLGEKTLTGSVAGVSVTPGSGSSIVIRGAASFPSDNPPLYVVDGHIVSSIADLSSEAVISTSVLTGSEATALYGARANNGVVIITTKKGEGAKTVEAPKVRTNFNETGFFLPHLRTDSQGSISFSFTAPEALTRWKVQALAHTKDGAFGVNTKELTTQKSLMVQPHLPRTLRQGDHLELTARLVNLSGKELTGQVQLELLDAATGQSVDGWFQNVFPNQYFTVGAGQSEVVKFPVEVPAQFTSTLKWRIVARAESWSDGEEALLPVLSSKILVTESLPLPMKGAGTKTFSLDKLARSGGSETLQHQALTVEYTSNPAWLAVQALPYLMEYPYECAEQVWNRVYANALSATILRSNPRIKSVLEQWKTGDTTALTSSLQKNEELKSVLLEETPWVLAAKDEAAQKKNLALLFDAERQQRELRINLEKLKALQLTNGAFPWFPGGPENRYITQYIVTGIGRLGQLGALDTASLPALKSILSAALAYLDRQLADDYQQSQKWGTDQESKAPGALQLQYLYLRSFFPDRPLEPEARTAYAYYSRQAKLTWMQGSKLLQGMTALVLHRAGDTATGSAILRSLKETAVGSEEEGMYWKEVATQRSPFWWGAPIETQALLIEAFAETARDTASVNLMRTWLLRSKQTTQWRTTTATADAVYALLLRGSEWLSSDPQVRIKLGTTTLTDSDEKREAGTGYFKKTFGAQSIRPDMGNITVTVLPAGKPGAATTPSWGAIYWQYFEEMDRITPAATPLRVTKKLFVEKASDRGPLLLPVEEGTELKVGDKLKVRLEIRTDRDLDYVHLKDLRASALEPASVLSGYKWQGGLGYYETARDASTNFFFQTLPKGTYVFEYPLYVTHTGTFNNGITTLQCLYAPEFSAHTESVNLRVE